MALASHEKYQVDEVSPANSALQPFPVGDFHIPCNWDSDNHTARNTELFTLVKLSDKCWEYKSIESEFTKAGAKILRIDRIENKELWEKFHSESKRMLRNRTGVNEVYLFHGSKGKKEDICCEGLDQRLSRIGHFGRGIYFSNDVRKCFFYTKERTQKKEQAEQKESTVYKCRVLLGIVKVYPKGQNAKDLKREPALDEPGPLGLKYYDSVKGQISEFEEFIVYKSERVLPEYIITCLPPAPSLTGSASLPAFTTDISSAIASAGAPAFVATAANGHSNSAPSSPTNSVEYDEEEAWELEYDKKQKAAAKKPNSVNSADEVEGARLVARGVAMEERSISVEEEEEEKCESADENGMDEDVCESAGEDEVCESAGEEDEDLYSAGATTTNGQKQSSSGASASAASTAPGQGDQSTSAAAPLPTSVFQSDEEFEKHLLEVRRRVQEKRRANNDTSSSSSISPSTAATTSSEPNYSYEPVNPALDDEHQRRLLEVRRRMQEKRRREKEGLPDLSDEEQDTTDTAPATETAVDTPDDNVNEVVLALVPQFQEFTGCEDIEEATRYIKHAQMDLNDAIMMYLNAAV